MTAIVISADGAYVTVAIEIAKAELHRHRRFLEMLLQAATPPVVEDRE